MRFRLLAAAGFVVAATVPGGARPVAPAETGFSPESFFAGRTRSSGVTTDVFGTPTGRVSGETSGRRLRDGSTEMSQTIRLSDGTTRRRTWRIVRTGPTTLEATGSDVVGKASGEIEGRRMRLVSTIRWAPGTPFGELEFEQELELQPDGRTVVNKSTISKFGAVVQKVDETFVRQ